MLEELKNKNVKLVISSNSGVSADGGLIVATSMIVVQGTLAEYDNEFVKLKNVQVMRNNVMNNKTGQFTVNVEPRIETPEVLLVNRNNIITVASVSEQ